MDFLFMLSASLSVSLDSFFCGLSLTTSKKNRIQATLTIALTVGLMCFFGAFIGYNAKSFLTKFAPLIAGVTLTAISVFKILNASKGKDIKEGKTSIIKYIPLGIAVGIDGLIGSFSLVLIGYNVFFVSAIITILHTVLLYASISVSLKIVKHKFIYKFPPVILLILGIYKIVCFFI